MASPQLLELEYNTCVRIASRQHDMVELVLMDKVEIA